jgi:hypothetical protein
MMQTFENPPRSPTKRLPLALNLDTGYRGKGKGRDVSPPHTPRAQSSHNGRVNNSDPNRALRVPDGSRQTWLDDITPVDHSNKENVPAEAAQQRDPHDLSLSPREVTRDSLVDHMLLSLDQFSYDQDDEGQPTADEVRLYSTFADEESYQPPQNFAPPRNARPAHNYSYSSDYDNADDSSRYSQLSRSRRSNSSSNFQLGLGRLNNARNDTGSNPAFRGPPIQIPSRGLHSRSGKGSKGSSANSFDLGYAQVTSNQRWAHGLPGRSSSFDYGDRSGLQSNSAYRQMDNTAPAFSPLSPYDYDAAPTPTIPGGPRRPRPTSPILISRPEPPKIEPVPPKLERKRSTRSSKSAYKSKPVSGGRIDYGLSDNTRELPPLPAFAKETAPAPLVGYGKTKEPAQQPQPSKDRPGFFRRVFGSSKNIPAASPDPPSSHGSSMSAETTSRPNSKAHHIGNQIRPHYAPPPPREPPPPPKEHTHTLTKKPSSFFRRRKKSVSEPEHPVPVPSVPPIQFQPRTDVSQPLPSPVSSLRKVMNPYLKSPGKSPLDSEYTHGIDSRMDDFPGDDRNVRGFSPDYEPDKKATIRTVKPSSRDDDEPRSSSTALAQKSLAPPSHGRQDRQSKDDGDGTFLQDASDNDPDAHSDTSKSAPQTAEAMGAKWLGGFASPPSPSIARDMELVAEYERVHSKRSPASAKQDLAKASPPLESPQSATGPKAGQVESGDITYKGVKDEEWVMLTPTKLPEQEDNRVWLEPTSSEEELGPKSLELPIKAANASDRTSGSTDTIYKSASSLPIVQIDGTDEASTSGPQLMNTTDALRALDEHVQDNTIPQESDRDRARQIYDGNEDFIPKEKAAAWMGEEGASRSRTLVAYFELYDFGNLNILAALRVMCNRLVLKAESQQVDRILEEFAQRWCQCNPNHGFKHVGEFLFPVCESAPTNDENQMLCTLFVIRYSYSTQIYIWPISTRR